MCLIEIVARKLGRALAPLALIGILAACAGRPAFAQPSAVDDSTLEETYNDGRNYADYYDIGVWVAPNSWVPYEGYYVYIGNLAIAGLFPPAYTDCSCQSQPAGSPVAGYYDFYSDILDWSSGNDWSLNLWWYIYVPSASESDCTGSCCANGKNLNVLSEYWGSEYTILYGYTTH